MAATIYTLGSPSVWCLVDLCLFVCLFVLGFYGPVNNEVMSSGSVNSGTVPGQA